MSDEAVVSDYFAEYREERLSRGELIESDHRAVGALRNTKRFMDFKLGERPVTDKDRKFFYVSDLHLDERLKLNETPAEEWPRKIEGEVLSLTSTEHSGRDVLLIGGDVSRHPFVVNKFYDYLEQNWDGLVVGVLGNHELWPGDPEMRKSYRPGTAISAQEMIDYYLLSDANWMFRTRHNRSIDSNPYFMANAGPYLVDNSLIIDIEGSWSYLNQHDIESLSDDDLGEILSKSPVFILAGVGWAGCNPSFNADAGIYRGVVDREEEIHRSKEFAALYHRCLRLASESTGVVLTHMPMRDWLEQEVYNSNWFYVSGHTHRNGLYLDDGNHVFFDNQLGYDPENVASLEYFSIQNGIYDPLSDFGDGIWVLTEQEYIGYLRTQGIHSEGCKWPGDICLVQKSGFRAFFLQNKKGRLCILRGGWRSKVNRSLDYYFENLERYGNAVIDGLTPYRQYLEQISRELKFMGFSGKVHGSIVDIDFYNHINVSPVDNRITIYRAYDILLRNSFPSVSELLVENIKIHKRNVRLSSADEKQKARFELVGFTSALSQLDGHVDSGLYPVLSSLNGDVEEEDHAIGEDLKRSEFYTHSELMLGLQRTLDHRIIQVWNDDVIDILDRRTESGLLQNDEAIALGNIDGGGAAVIDV